MFTKQSNSNGRPCSVTKSEMATNTSVVKSSVVQKRARDERRLNLPTGRLLLWKQQQQQQQQQQE